MASLDIPWHDGELKIHKLLSSPRDINPTVSLLSAGARNRFSSSPLIAVGARDNEGRPWATVWGGQRGLAEPLGGSLLGVTTEVDVKHDPVIEALFSDENGKVNASEGQMVRRQALISGLAIDLEKRLRWKMAGKMLGGAVVKTESRQADDNVEDSVVAGSKVQLIVQVEQSLGNCPKYLNSKRIRPAAISDSTFIPSASPADLSPESIALIHKADLFFVSSFNGDIDTDTNHRGGPHGFVRVHRSSSSDSDIHPWELVWPDYSGNRLYQTLGNLAVTPQAGLVFPDFDTGDVLYLTGDTEILVGKDAAAVITRSNLAVKVKITGTRFVKQGLPFRGDALQPSPYNPRVRSLTSEALAAQAVGGRNDNDKSKLTATLLSHTKVTPTISRFRFFITSNNSSSSSKAPPPTWTPAQWVALDFGTELDIGYSHMRDDDPLSLNDDFIRTFTVSSPPPLASTSTASSSSHPEFDITIRSIGTATRWLFTQNPRSHIELPVLGFGGGGDDALLQPEAAAGDSSILPSTTEITPFIAGGIGITPLLGQLEVLDPKRLRVFWSVARRDFGLVVDVLGRGPEWLGGCLEVFVTGGVGMDKDTDADGEKDKEELQYIRQRVRVLEMRRLLKNDLELEKEVWNAKRWMMCAGKTFREFVTGWLEEDRGGREVVFEDFNF